MATPRRTSHELVGADGGPLRVDVRRQPGGARPAVIIGHGFNAFKDWGFFPVLAERLARAGLTAVSFNTSGSGVGPEGETFTEPERFGRATFTGDLHDLATVWDALRAGELGAAPLEGRIGLVGHSRGGGTAIVFAAERPVSALVTWNPIASVGRWGKVTLLKWRMAGRLNIENLLTGGTLPLYTDILDDIKRNAERLDLAAQSARIEAPWLNVVGTGDIVTPPAVARWAPGPGRETLSIEGAGHTFGARHPWAGSTVHLDDAMERTVGFLLETLTGA